LQHDPVQRAAAADGREREALERIGRWHGATQLRIALLALLTDAGPASAQDRWQAWTDGLHFAADTRATLSLLGPAGRREALELLTARMAATPQPEQTLLLRQARDLGEEAPALRLRCIALRHRLKTCARRLHWHLGPAMAQMAEEALAATRALALAVPFSAVEALQWQQAVVQALALPQRSLAGAVHWRRALGLRRLSSIDRPRVLRAWLQALPTPADERALEALLMACWILDTPLPPALGGTAQ
jgi:hypothetical protein